jgi:hypothetical protein
MIVPLNPTSCTSPDITIVARFFTFAPCYLIPLSIYKYADYHIIYASIQKTHIGMLGRLGVAALGYTGRERAVGKWLIM